MANLWRWVGLGATAAMIAACSSADSDAPGSGGSTGSATSGPSAGGNQASGGGGMGQGASDEYVTLFDGTLTDDWRMSSIINQPGQDNPGHFEVHDGALISVPGTDLGLLWNTRPTPADFVLELEFRLSAPDDNSGVFVRFPDLEGFGYNNTAWVAINFGFEVQIDETGSPDGADVHTTGAIYGEMGQSFTRVEARPQGMWNAYEIRVEGQVYSVRLNGQDVTRFENPHHDRGLASTPSTPSFLGLQTHSGNVAFRNIRIRALP